MKRDHLKFPFNIGQSVSVVLKNKTLKGIVIDEYESNVFDEIDEWIKKRHAVLYKVKLSDGTIDTFYPYELYPVMPTLGDIMDTIKVITDDFFETMPKKKIVGVIENDDRVGIPATDNTIEPTQKS